MVVMSQQVLNQLIQSIPDWRTSTPEKVWQDLTQKTVKKADTRKWKSIDLAKLIGWDQVDNFFNYLAQNKCQWVVDLAAGDGLEIGDDPVNTVLRGFNNPVCQQLADLGIHYVSMLEDAGIETTKELIDITIKNMKLADLKELREEQAWDRIQAYKEAWTNYDGVGPEPVL
jgi:hypothetical protein